jgi:peptidoglycan hydrolase-like protein with peptidoglycan-binding domain
MTKKWTSVLAMSMAGVMAATMAFAQGSGSGGGGTTAPAQTGTQQPKPEGMSKDAGTPADTMKSTTESTKSTDMKNGDAKKSGATRSGTMTKSNQRENVRAAQQALKDKGMDPGTVDGMMGPKTQAALREYQKKEGLKETGRLDAETMAKLGVEAKTSAGATDQGSPAASPPTAPDAATTPADATKNGAAKDGTKK